MINRTYDFDILNDGSHQLKATYYCKNGELLFELFEDNIAYNAISMHIVSEIEQVVSGSNDSFTWSGNTCYVESDKNMTCIYDSYAEGDEYENTKCQLSTSDFLFLMKEWIEKKKEFRKKYPDNILQRTKTKIFEFFGKKI